MQDLRNYSDQELSLIVFNTECLYVDMHHSWFIDTLSELFNYTPDQLDELKQDIADDYAESQGE